MIKKFIVCDVIAGIAIMLELVILALGMDKMGAAAYILLDAAGAAIILFIVNFLGEAFSKEAEEGMELSLSDGSEFGQILNDGFYLVVAFAGGQIGIRMKLKRG